MWLLRLELGRGASQELKTSEQGHCPASTGVWGDAVRLVRWHGDTANWNQLWLLESTVAARANIDGVVMRIEQEANRRSKSHLPQPACSLHPASIQRGSHMPKEKVTREVLSNHHKECGAENNNSIMARRKEKTNQCAYIYILVH